MKLNECSVLGFGPEQLLLRSNDLNVLFVWVIGQSRVLANHDTRLRRMSASAIASAGEASKGSSVNTFISALPRQLRPAKHARTTTTSLNYTAVFVHGELREHRTHGFNQARVPAWAYPHNKKDLVTKS